MKLYKDSKNREGYWRVKLPTGKYKTFQAPTESMAYAIAQSFVDELNQAPPTRTAWESLVDTWVKRREIDDKVHTLAKWPQYKNELYQFARKIKASPETIQPADLTVWWDSLTRHQQDNVLPEFSRFSAWLIMTQRIPQQPFPEVGLKRLKKPLPPKQRPALSLELYNATLREAEHRGYHDLVIAMQLSKVTALRLGDICKLTFVDNVRDGCLRIRVGKSFAQHGDIKAARLEWSFEKHPAVAELVKKASLLSSYNYNAPHLVSNRTGKETPNKAHPFQVPALAISKKFTECIKAVDGRRPTPTFHCIRGLAAALLEAKGVTLDDIKLIMAHTDVDTTQIYLQGHERRYHEVTASNGL